MILLLFLDFDLHFIKDLAEIKPLWVQRLLVRILLQLGGGGGGSVTPLATYVSEVLVSVSTGEFTNLGHPSLRSCVCHSRRRAGGCGPI